MKFRKGLVIGVGLAFCLQNAVVFASDVSSEAISTTSTVTCTIDEVSEETATEETTTEETATEETTTEETATEETATEETTTEETTTEETTTEETTTEETTTEETVTEETVTEEPVVEEPVVEEPVVVEVLPEIKANATLLITNKLLCDDGEIVLQEEIKDLVAGTSVDIAEYVHENEDVKAVNGTGTIELVEGQNEIVIEYRFVSDIEEENNTYTVEEDYDGELMY